MDEPEVVEHYVGPKAPEEGEEAEEEDKEQRQKRKKKKKKKKEISAEECDFTAPIFFTPTMTRDGGVRKVERGMKKKMVTLSNL